MKKYFAIILSLLLVFSLFAGTAGAASYSACKSKILGWSTSTSKTTGQKISTATVVSVDNTKGTGTVTYKKTITTTNSVTVGGSLSSSISGSLNAGTGVVSGGLASGINSEIKFSGTLEKSASDAVSTTIPKGKKLTIYADKMGDKLSGYAKYFVAWICTKSGTTAVSVPKYVNWRFVQS